MPKLNETLFRWEEESVDPTPEDSHPMNPLTAHTLQREERFRVAFLNTLAVIASELTDIREIISKRKK